MRGALSITLWGWMLAGGVATAHAAESSGATAILADYERAAAFVPARANPLVLNTFEDANWLPDGRLWYRSNRAGGREYVIVDPRARSRRALFDEGRLRAALPAVADGRFDLHDAQLSDDARRLTFSLESRLWSCNLQRYDCSSVEVPKPSEVLSPDGKRAVFIREFNLWMRDVATGRERQLTQDGVRDYGYATDNVGWKHTDRAIVSWSPDSHRIATYQQDERNVGEMVLIRTKVGRPAFDRWKYPLPGDATVPKIERVVIDVEAATVARLKMPADERRTAHCYDFDCGPGGSMTDLEWTPDSREFAFVSVSRDHKQVWLRVADALTGDVREVLQERESAYYESATAWHGDAVNWRLLPQSQEVVWFSQRDGWGHLYLYDLKSGALKNRITQGEGNVMSLEHIDTRRRELFFVGVGHEAGRDPYFQHLYRVGLDGSGQTLLTAQDANHDVTLAPTADYFVDDASRPDVPGVAVLRDRKGRSVLSLEKADVSALAKLGWRPPRPITVKAHDGKSELYGLMYVPSTLDESRRYPVIDHVYPGPQIGSVGPRRFRAARGDSQALAELGFIVVQIDGTGTSLRSKAFRDVSYGNLGENTLSDQVAGLKQLIGTHAWMDGSRVGIWGHSGGGGAAAAALLRYPDFFSVGVAESGNHDQRGYEGDWGEQYMGLLTGDVAGASNYSGQDNPGMAAQLKGHLLLMHGVVDDNVPLGQTLLLSDALIRANRDFDLLLLPDQEHSYRGVPGDYAMRRRWDYFVRHLQGGTPPVNFAIAARMPRGTHAED